MFTGCSSSSASPSSSVLLGAGSTEFRQGDYNGATQLFEQAIKRDPTNAMAHYDLGTVYQAENQDGPALTQYTLALRQAPDLVPAIFNQATIDAVHDVRTGGVPLPEDHLDTAGFTDGLSNLGLIEALEGDLAQSGVDLRQAVHLEGSLRGQIPASGSPISRPTATQAQPAARRAVISGGSETRSGIILTESPCVPRRQELTQSDCLFCKILAGEIPSKEVARPRGPMPSPTSSPGGAGPCARNPPRHIDERRTDRARTRRHLIAEMFATARQVAEREESSTPDTAWCSTSAATPSTASPTSTCTFSEASRWGGRQASNPG